MCRSSLCYKFFTIFFIFQDGRLIWDVTICDFWFGKAITLNRVFGDGAQYLPGVEVERVTMQHVQTQGTSLLWVSRLRANLDKLQAHICLFISPVFHAENKLFHIRRPTRIWGESASKQDLLCIGSVQVYPRKRSRSWSLCGAGQLQFRKKGLLHFLYSF